MGLPYHFRSKVTGLLFYLFYFESRAVNYALHASVVSAAVLELEAHL